MRILVMLTGGTIGSEVKGDFIDVNADKCCPVCDYYAKNHPDIAFDKISPLNILSERISAADFNTLGSALFTADYTLYDGVIVTSGSDALAYISSFVGLVLSRLNKPVCIVAADKVFSDKSSNALDNFTCAVELIKRGEIGAFVPYRNSDGIIYIHSATDLRQADLSDDFFSFSGAYAVYNGSIKVKRELISHKIPKLFDKENLPKISDNILMLHPYPLFDYSTVSTVGKKAVLHTLYHSGTLDSSKLASFKKTIQDKPLYLASLKSGRQIYATTAETVAMGATPLFDIAPECAYVKLMLAFSQDRLSVDEFMFDNMKEGKI